MREKSIIHATVATTRNGLRELTVGKKTKRPAEVSGWQGLGRGPVAGDAKDPEASRFCRHGPAVGGRGQARGWEGAGGGRWTGQRDGGGRALTGTVGLAFEDVQLGAVGQRVLQAELEEAGLGLAHALEQRQQRNSLLALVPALKPARQHPDLVAKHHG